MDLIAVAVFACDANGDVLWSNRRATELARARVHANVHANDDPGTVPCSPVRAFDLAGPIARVLATGVAVVGIETEVSHAGAPPTFALASIQPARDESGAVIGAIVSLEEATALHRAEAQAEQLRGALDQATRRIEASESRCRQILDALPEAVYTTDAAGFITYYNRAAAEISGREPAIGIDRWSIPWRLYNADGTPSPVDACPMAIAVTQNHPVRGVEMLLERPDGRLVPILPYPTPISDAAGNVLGGVDMLIDLSERRRAEADQLGLLRELHHRVKNNMQTLLSLLSSAARESETVEARAGLSAASRRVAVIGAAQQVLYGADDSGTTYCADALLESVARIAVNGAVPAVDIRVDATPMALSNDTAVPLALILNELLSNAVRFGGTLDDPSSIDVSLTASGGTAQLVVTDSGPGFLPDLASLKRASGLGLVRGLARQLGGALTIDGERGTRCTVRFSDRSLARNDLRGAGSGP